MVDPVNSGLIPAAGAAAPGGVLGSGAAAKGATGTSAFADMLQRGIEDVSKLQQDASKAVEDLATGKSDDVTGAMTAVEKSDVAFKTLLAIRGKLMDAYDEIKSMQM